MAILEVKNIEKHFGSTQVLKDVSFSMEEGNALAIIGSSGSGKTTLLRCLNFLETPDSGSIAVKGEMLYDASKGTSQNERELRKKRLHFGMVFQSFHLFPQYTALENVMLVLSGMSDEQQLIDNTAYMREFRPLDERERAAIARVVEELAAMPTIACTKCRYCVEGCPKKIPIPDVFEDYNMTVQFGINETNRGSYRRHTADGGSADVCIRCGKCEGQCPQHLPIRDLLVKVAETFSE